MKVVTLLNEKGGVGKTTLSTHIACGLAKAGKRVMLTDADPQGNATMYLGLNKKPYLYDLLIRDADWSDCLLAVPNYPTMMVLPGHLETRGIPQLLSDTFKFDLRVRQLADMFDVVVIDTPPTPSLFHSAILMATDWVIHPTECEFFSLNQLSSSIGHVENFSNERQNRMGLEPIYTLGIVPMMFDARTLEHRENVQKLQERYGELVWPQIPNRIVWSEASRKGLPVFDYDPKSDAAKDAQDLVDRLSKYVSEVA